MIKYFYRYYLFIALKGTVRCYLCTEYVGITIPILGKHSNILRGSDPESRLLKRSWWEI